jgi:acyl-CoA reductase-like NAD-dependent aldehyde dehydrogenase
MPVGRKVRLRLQRVRWKLAMLAGPIRQRQHVKVLGFIAQGKACGARLLTGGTSPGGLRARRHPLDQLLATPFTEAPWGGMKQGGIGRELAAGGWTTAWR